MLIIHNIFSINIWLYILDEEAQSKDPEGRLKLVSKTTRDILDTLDRDYKEPEKKIKEIAQKPDILNAVCIKF